LAFHPVPEQVGHGVKLALAAGFPPLPESGLRMPKPPLPLQAEHGKLMMRSVMERGMSMVGGGLFMQDVNPP
jgi:hypothetical protein